MVRERHKLPLGGEGLRLRRKSKINPNLRAKKESRDGVVTAKMKHRAIQ